MALSAPGGPVTFTIGIQQIRDIASGLVITLTPNSTVRLEVTPEVAALCASDLEAQLAEARAAERERCDEIIQELFDRALTEDRKAEHLRAHGFRSSSRPLQTALARIRALKDPGEQPRDGEG